MGNCSSWHDISENNTPAPVHSTTAHCGICVDIPLENSLYSTQEKPDCVVPNLFESVTGFLATRFPQITVFNSNGVALTASAVHGRTFLILKTVILII